MFLRDEQLHALLDPPSTVIEGLKHGAIVDSKGDAIQPASVDLTIGGIYVPGTKEGKRGSAGHKRDFLSLGPGETAVVETREICNMPANIGAIGFPPASVSANGLLTTNPGHVDPGYAGTLSFTVINMGSTPYELRSGAEIVTLLLFRLDGNARAPYATRSAPPHGGVTDDLLGRLSHDFLDVTKRTQHAAEGSERKTRVLGFAIPVVVASLALGGVYFQTSRANKDEITQLQQDVRVLQSKLELDQRVAKLEGSR